MRVSDLPKTKLLELSRTWWYKLNEYSLLLIISFPTAKENLSKPVKPRHITTGTVCNQGDRKINKVLFMYSFPNVLTDTKILNYRTDNFQKSTKSLFLQLVTSKTQINFFVQRPLIRINFLTEVITFLFRYIIF